MVIYGELRHLACNIIQVVVVVRNSVRTSKSKLNLL